MSMSDIWFCINSHYVEKLMLLFWGKQGLMHDFISFYKKDMMVDLNSIVLEQELA